MRLASAGRPHLGYCTNIHSGESLAEVRHNLERYVVAVKHLVHPDGPMGVGLRLSALAARELAAPGKVAELADFLREQGLYVFTINGFPYGEFHKGRVKEQVYLPDWLDDARLDYTNRLASLLSELMTDGLDEGSVSTSPGAFKDNVPTWRHAEQMAERMRSHAVFLHELEQRSGKAIVLAVEPEPACHLETVQETIDFFQDHVFSHAAVEQTAKLARVTPAQAEALLRRHLGVCFDTCHMAVEFEPAVAALDRLLGAGIRIGKVQISAGLQAPALTTDLRAFDDGVYLHQVVRGGDGNLVRYVDLDDAFAAASPRDASGGHVYRVHFHVPLFLETLGAFKSTQPYVREVLAALRERAICQHLEVETYTWDVLPAVYRSESIVKAIARELRWVKDEMTA